MDFYKRYSLAIGLLVLVGIVVILLTSPSQIFSRGVSFIDTELSQSSGQKAYVTTKIDFGNNEHVQAFPTEIGDWQSIDYDVTVIKESLGADTMLQRTYYQSIVGNRLFFVIVQADTDSSFHSPPICYQSAGYTIEEEEKDEFVVSATGWVDETEERISPPTISIPVKKLVVYKESDGKVVERRVVLYYYVEGNQFTSNTITMIRISAIVPVEGSYEEILNTEKDFAAETFPYMFGSSDEGDTEIIFAQLTGAGLLGYFAIAILIFIPLAIMFYPRIRKLSQSDKGSEQ